MDKPIVYKAEPTLEEFHRDTENFLRYIEGPFGSGKSTGCVMELLMQGFQQQPDDNKVRRTRWAIIRQTYPELKSTTIKTFEFWVPPTVAPVVYSIPIVAKFKQNLNDGTRAEIEFVFLALETDEDAKKLLSLELTGAYLNEAREIPWGIVEPLTGRVGRYPETIQDDEGNVIFGPTRKMIIADSNPPRTTHWLHTKFMQGDVPKGWKKYTQPPAVFFNEETQKWDLNPDAENLSHLQPDYYENMLSSSDDFIRVNLGGEPGMSRKGKPVHPKFSSQIHVAKEIIQPVRGAQIILGMDFGLTPATSVMQVIGGGIRILDELPATDETLEDYLAEYVQPLLSKKYQGYNVVACGDPSGKARDRHKKLSDFMILQSAGIKAFPANTNDPSMRIGTVNWFLSRVGGLLVSPHCTHTIEAFAGGYVLKETKNGSGQYTDVPLKNEFSHIMDGAQYGCLFARYGTRRVSAAKEPEKKKHLWA